MANYSLTQTFRFAWNHLSTESKFKLCFLAVARILVNLLDIAGIAAIGVLTLLFLPSSGSSNSVLSSFGIRVPNLTQDYALILASIILLLFISKSIISILLSRSTLIVLSRDENSFASDIAQFLPSYIGSANKVPAINTIQMTMGLGVRSLFTGALGTVLVFSSEGSLLLMIAILLSIANFPAALIMFSYFGLVSYLLMRYSNSKVYRYVSEAENATQLFNAELADFVGTSQEIKLLGKTLLWVKQLQKRRESISKSMVALQLQYSLPRHIIESALIAGIFLLLGIFVLISDLSTQAPTIALLLAGSLRLTAALVPIQNSLNVLKTHHANSKFALDLFETVKSLKSDARVFINSDVALSNGDEIIKFSAVSFSVGDSAESKILENLEFSIRKGEKFAIVGPSGSGKTTLIKLLLGTVAPTSGKIQITLPKANSDFGSLKNLFSFVPQKPKVLSAGADTNLTLDPLGGSITQSEIEEILARVKLNVKNRGNFTNLNTLSGGELQRLSLARALWADSEVIVLDEATSALDAVSESEVAQTLRELRKGVTQVVIAHRLSTIQDADRILYLDSGRIIAIANFDKLKKLVPDFNSAVRQMTF